MKLTIKNISILLIVLLICCTTANAQKSIKLEGIFQGENLFIMNPFASSGVGFCIYEVTVNGQVATDNINNSAFELNLLAFHLQKGERVAIEIKHKEGCTPKVLNANVLKPKSTYTISSIKLDKTGTLSFTTQGEMGSLPFIVEQFKWKKWVTVGKVQGKGTSGTNIYHVKVPLHSGINKVRVKQIDASKKPRYSNEITFNNLAPEVTFKPGNNGQTTGLITFSRATEYEIWDFYGKRVAKGNASSVNISSFPKGIYFINYDCKDESFEKR